MKKLFLIVALIGVCISSKGQTTHHRATDIENWTGCDLVITFFCVATGNPCNVYTNPVTPNPVTVSAYSTLNLNTYQCPNCSLVQPGQMPSCGLAIDIQLACDQYVQPNTSNLIHLNYPDLCGLWPFVPQWALGADNTRHCCQQGYTAQLDINAPGGAKFVIQ